MPQKSTTDKAASRKPTGASGYRQQQEAGELWTAPSGAIVRIRPLDITDYTVISQFPDNLQQMIYQAIEASEVLSDTPTRNAPESEDDVAKALFTGMTGKQVVEQAYDLSVRMCKLAWIDPQVVDDVTDPDTQISVDELKGIDRTGFMAWLFRRQGVEAGELATFPERSN